MFFSSPILNFSNKKLELDEIFYHKNPGIPEKDLRALQTFASDKEVVLLIRPVEPLTKSLHEAGQYPTKNFKIKGKSSSWGAWAGFIPIDQAFSKLFNATNEVIKKSNRGVQTCIEQQDALTTHLRISEERFQELRKKEIIYSLNKKEGEFLVIYCPYPHDDEHLEKFALCYAKKIKIGSIIEYAFYTAEKKPFYVLADTVLKKPLIADYDLLAIFSPWRNFNQDNIRPNPEVTLAERHRKLSPREQRRSMESEKRFYDRELPNLGNITRNTIKIISELNIALNKTGPLACIHHNDDAGSPASNPEANYPITVLMPKLKGFTHTCLLINTADEFTSFIDKIKQLDYRVEANPLWEKSVQLAAKEDFYQKIISLERNNPEKLKNSLKGILQSIGITDSTLIKEITHILLLTMQCHLEIELVNFFKTIESCSSINSVLVSQWCSVLDTLLNKNLLTHGNFLKIQDFIQKLKGDILGFSKLSATLINFDTLDAFEHIRPEKKLEYVLSLAEKCIQENKLDHIQFNNGLSEKLSENLMQLSLNPPEESLSPLFKP